MASRTVEVLLLFVIAASAITAVASNLLPHGCVNISASWNRTIDRSRHRDFVLRHRGVLQRGRCRTLIVRDCPDEPTARQRAMSTFGHEIGIDWLDPKKVTCTPYEVDPQKNFFEYVP